MKTNNFISFLIIYIFQLIYCQNNKILYRCGADDDKTKPLPMTNFIKIKKDKRNLNDGEFKDFHIYLDLINIKNDIKKYNLEKYEELFIDSLNKGVETLESLLQVKKLNKFYILSDHEILYLGIKDWNQTMIGSNSIGDMKTMGIDLVILGRFDEKMDSSSLASAGIRYYEKETGQPLVGIININTKANYSKINSKEYFQSIVLHEFTHILGFTYAHLNDFVHNIFTKKDKYGITRYYVNSTKVIEVAKKYFNCSDIDGVELEEYHGEGTAGSHWEARILLGEYMNGVIYPEEQVISEFTLALLEDTGYYKAKYYTGGLMRYGKGKGCAFVKDRCIDSFHEINPLFENEFYDSIYSPTLIDASCSSGRQSRTYNAWYKYENIPNYYQYFSLKERGGYAPADYCPVPREDNEEVLNIYYTGHCSKKGNGGYGTKIFYQKKETFRVNSTHIATIYINYFNTSNELNQITGETYSDHSFCYQSTLIKKNFNYNTSIVRSLCYESFCSNFSLTIKIHDDYIVCPRSGGKIKVEGYTGYFICPDYNLICSGTVICNDMFDCVNKKSEIKENTYIYDYKIKTSQNIESFEINNSDDINNYEIGNDGICPINCKQCKLDNKCTKCRNDYGLIGSKKNNEVYCILLTEFNSKGYYQKDNIYYPCIENCVLCSNDISCDKCIDKFVFANNKCLIEINHCKIYGIDELCDECIDNYIIKDNNRTICIKKLSIFIIQVQIINNKLKVYFLVSTSIDDNYFKIIITINLYKNNTTDNYIRNNEETPYENHIVNLYLNNNTKNMGNILEFSSEEEFDDNDRIILQKNLGENSLYDLKVLNNEDKYLDTEENKKMIQNKEIVDFSKIDINTNNNYQINEYIINSVSKGCKFDLISNIPIEEKSQSVNLYLFEKDKKNNKVNITCIISKENKNKIPCSIEQEIDINFYLDSYIGLTNESIFYIIQDNDKEYFELYCKNEEENKKKLNIKIIIIIIVVVVVVIIVTIIIIVICCKKKDENITYGDKKQETQPAAENNIDDISFTTPREKV